MKKIEVKNLTKIFNGKLAINKINFSELNFLSHFFVPTAKNIVIYSENISSMKSFPFFLWAFVLFGFYEINFKPKKNF